MAVVSPALCKVAVDANGHRVVLIIALSSPDGTNDFLMALTEVLRKAGVEQADFRREGVRRLAEDWMEMELAERVRAERHERTPLTAPATATGTASARAIRVWARSS